METVRVAVRVRPLSPKEVDEGAQICCHIPEEDTNQIFIGDRSFTFDTVLPPSCGQHNVYQSCCAPLLQSFLEGFNCTVFAYGQTGSGKTFSTEGIIEMFVPSLFDALSAIQDECAHAFAQRSEREGQPTADDAQHVAFALRISAMEIHNDVIKDLLPPHDHDARPSETLTDAAVHIAIADGERAEPNCHADPKRKSLPIREGANGSVVIVGLTEKVVTSVDDVFATVSESLRTRTVGGTQMNEESSRSHAIITVTLEQRRDVSTDPAVPVYETITSKFCIVDLAGSERQKRTGATGMRLKESIHINSGLLSLGNVISSLCEREEFPHRRAHVSYRDSKLTRVLQDSLGGNSVTVMLACISPADVNFEETLSTLKYANRAKNIRNKPVKNRDPQIERIQSLEKELAAAKRLLAEHGIPFSGDTPQVSPKIKTALRADGPSPRSAAQSESEVVRKCTKLLESTAPQMPVALQSVFIAQRKSLSFEEKLKAFVRWSAETSARAGDMERYIQQLQAEFAHHSPRVSDGSSSAQPATPTSIPIASEFHKSPETQNQTVDASPPEVVGDLEKVTQERTEIVNQRIDLTARRRALQMEREKVERQQVYHGKTLEMLEAEIKSRENIIHELIMREYEAERVLEEYTENIHEVEAERNRAQADLARALKALESRQLSKDMMDKEARRLHSQADTRIRQLEHSIAELRRRHAKAEDAMRQHRVEKAQLRKLSGELNRLREQHDTAQTKIRESMVRSAQLRKESSAREKFLLKQMERVEHQNMVLSRSLDKKDAEIKRMKMSHRRAEGHQCRQGRSRHYQQNIADDADGRRSHSTYGIDVTLDVSGLRAKKLVEEQKLAELEAERGDLAEGRAACSAALTEFQNTTKEKVRKSLIGWNRRITELAQSIERISAVHSESEDIARLQSDKEHAENAHAQVMQYAQDQEQALFERLRKADDALDSLDASIAFHVNRHSIFSQQLKRVQSGM